MRVVLANDDGASTAATFTASELCAGEAFASNELEKCEVEIVAFGRRELEAGIVDSEDELGCCLSELGRQLKAVDRNGR